MFVAKLGLIFEFGNANHILTIRVVLRYLSFMAFLLRYLILGIIAYFAVQVLRRKLVAYLGPDEKQSGGPSVDSDPYEILGVRKGASKAEIKKAYKSALSKYHPDKVEHLGEELKTVARNKTIAITSAYQKLR